MRDFTVRVSVRDRVGVNRSRVSTIYFVSH